LRRHAFQADGVETVAYVEDLHPPGDGPEISVIVVDLASGHEQCFIIDLDTGEAEPCG
jgi:hypothetical protein